MHRGPDRAERGSGRPDDSRRCFIEPVCIVAGIIGEFADGRVSGIDEIMGRGFSNDPGRREVALKMIVEETLRDADQVVMHFGAPLGGTKRAAVLGQDARLLCGQVLSEISDLFVV